MPRRSDGETWWHNLRHILGRRHGAEELPAILEPEFFHQALHREWSRSQRIRLPLSMVVFSRESAPAGSGGQDGLPGYNGNGASHTNGNGNGNDHGKVSGNGKNNGKLNGKTKELGNGNGHGNGTGGPGDENALGRYAQALGERIRCTDLIGWLEVGKLGVLLPHTTGRSAWRLAEEIQARMDGAENAGRGVSKVEIKVYAYPAEEY